MKHWRNTIKPSLGIDNMRLIFKKLEIHSFMPFEDEVFEFDKMTGLTLVKGINHDIPDETNGAGKSCTFLALLYVLFGEV